MYCGTLQSWFSCEFLAISYQKMPCILSTISLFSVLPTFPLTPSNYLRRWWLQGKQTMRNLWTWFSRPNSKWRTRDSMTLSRCSCSLQSAVEESWPLEGGHPHVLPSQNPVKTNTRLIVYLLWHSLMNATRPSAFLTSVIALYYGSTFCHPFSLL